MSDLGDIELRGYSVIPGVVNDNALAELIGDLTQVLAKNRGKIRPGLRTLLSISPRCREVSQARSIRTLIEPILGKSAQVVRGIYFDKRVDANWKVAWHQDLSIAVKAKAEIERYGPWSVKAGITHVQPPVSVLEQMLTVRLHLDDTDETNGALRVVPGSHRLGRLSAAEIHECAVRMEVEICNVPKGGVMLMRPLLVHSSSKSQLLRQRRIVYLEYSMAGLPAGLEWNED